MKRLFLNRILLTTIIMTAVISCSDGIDPKEDSTGEKVTDPVFPGSSDGDYTVSGIFTDGMVLQRNSTVSVFGSADKGRQILVSGSWSEDTVKVYPFKDGKFVAKIKTPDAGGPYTLSVNDSTYTDVMIGEVWLCAGQSNMQLRLSQTNMAGVANENNPDIRMFTVKIAESREPQDTIPGGAWYYGPVQSIKNQVSATGYYFARMLNQELDIPIGMICTARGSTGAEEWLNGDVFETLPDNVKNAFEQTDIKWPGCWYNAMVCPLFNYSVKGAIWYQGENNSSRPQTYQILMQKLVEDWRERFNNETMSFYMVQLPSFNKAHWSPFRIVQQRTAESIPYCSFITSIDTGEKADIHPKNKLTIGNRLAELALANDYGIEGYRSAPPVLDKIEYSSDKIKATFRNVTGIKSKTADPPQYFEICGADGRFYPADVVIVDNKTILISSEDVPVPKNVRYYWTGWGTPNFVDSDGWPIAPFNTIE